MRINQYYLNLLKRPGLKETEKIFIKEKLKKAMDFIKSIHQRGNTLNEITKYILDKQRLFLEGKSYHLQPMSIKELAENLDRHESTISRSINNKYIDTPVGLYPFKYFFNQTINSNNGNISSQQIKEEIRELIEEENKKCPLSDLQIQEHFKNKGYQLARRTISKYRQQLQIPSSHLR